MHHLAGASEAGCATAGMIASQNITCPTCRMPSAGVDVLLIAVIVCETIQLGSEIMQMLRQNQQYLQDGGWWNVLDLFTSGCLMAAAVSYFSKGSQTVKTFGSIGVACKWFGRETALVLCAAMCACY